MFQIHNGESVLPDGVNFTIKLSIESRLDQVALLRAALSGIFNHLRVVESDIFSLQLAVTEIVNNSFEHGYKQAEDKHIDVHINVCGTDVTIDLNDEAPPFPKELSDRLLNEPLPQEDPNERWPVRGHGFQIVRLLVDSHQAQVMRWVSNCIVLRKRVGLLES